jgi:hypothetical protein
MRLLWLASVLREAGLTVVEYHGWQSRGTSNVVFTMDPRVVVAHHTATGTNWSDAAVEYLLALKGNSTTPPPLCHLGLRRTGVYVVIASGVANHAGPGSWKDATSNRHAVGIEAYNNGIGEPWPQVQLDAYDRGVAALLRRMERSAYFLAGHKEWRPKTIGKYGPKIDPTGIDMADMRTRVGRILEEDTMTPLQARLELATAWHTKSGEWMTAQTPETAQGRLTRLSLEVLRGERTIGEIIMYAPQKVGTIQSEPVPSWVLDMSVPSP